MALIPPGNGINYQTLNRRRIVAIIGAGLFGRSLALRLNQCPDVIVRVGSRNPKEGQTTIREAVSQASIIFLTVPAHAHDDVAQAITPFIRENAIVVDVSNYPLTSPPEEGCPISIAERLQILFPSCRVVKGFNTVSSYELATCHSTPTVFLATNETETVTTLSMLCYQVGLMPIHTGRLKNATKLESIPHRLFPKWRLPIYLLCFILTFWIGYKTLTIFVLHRPGQSTLLDWKAWPLKILSSSTAQTSGTLFALTFLPGPIIGVLQFIHKSTSIPLPTFFGNWLNCRKELGTCAFFFASIHAFSEMATRGEGVSQMPLSRSLYLSFGILAYFLSTVPAISSVPGIADRMTWREFQFVFSHLGTACFIFGFIHQLCLAVAYWIKRPQLKVTAICCDYLMTTHWLGIIIPSIAFAARIVTWLPCVASKLRRIRHGNLDHDELE